MSIRSVCPEVKMTRLLCLSEDYQHPSYQFLPIVLSFNSRFLFMLA
ncbi:hypothetical protein Hanom_Chr03g00270161 [Helianthus anomalus]